MLNNVLALMRGKKMKKKTAGEEDEGKKQEQNFKKCGCRSLKHKEE